MKEERDDTKGFEKEGKVFNRSGTRPETPEQEEKREGKKKT